MIMTNKLDILSQASYPFVEEEAEYYIRSTTSGEYLSLQGLDPSRSVTVRDVAESVITSSSLDESLFVAVIINDESAEVLGSEEEVDLENLEGMTYIVKPKTDEEDNNEQDQDNNEAGEEPSEGGFGTEGDEDEPEAESSFVQKRKNSKKS